MPSKPQKLVFLEDSAIEARSLLLCDPIRQRFLKPIAELPKELPNLNDLKANSRSRTRKKRTPDPEEFLDRSGIGVFSDLSEFESTEVVNLLAKASVVVVQRYEDAIKVVDQQKFDLVISDLFLFDPSRTNAPERPQSLTDFPLQDRCEQVKRPAGLRFVKELRRGKSNRATPNDVPIIAMTFFWTLPRFKRYVEELMGYDPPVGYLPKYFKADNKELVHSVGHPSLDLLIDLLLSRDRLTKRLTPLLFRGLGLELLAHASRLKSHKALHKLHESQHDFVRSIIDFRLVFEVTGLPRPNDVSDEFDWIVSAVMNDAIDSGEVKFSFHVYNPETWELHKPLPSGSLLKIPARSQRQVEIAKRQFVLLLALAVYTYPLADHPHTLKTGDMVDILQKLGMTANEATVRQDIHHLRRELQEALPRELFEVASAKNHILVSHGDSGYYLNGEHEIRFSQ